MSFQSCTFLAATALLCAFTAGCGIEVYQPARVAAFEPSPSMEIDDEDIGKAFAARPQLPEKPNIAYYVFDNDYAEEVDQMLGALPGAPPTYRIPPIMVTGERRFDHEGPGQGREPAARPLSIKQLRLLAARAHADVLVVVDYGYKVERDANGLAALGVLLIPLLFVPFEDIAVESYVDSYVIDVRNGYLYGHLQTSEEQRDDYHTIYSSYDDTMVDGQFDVLVERTGKLLGGLLAGEDLAG